jgi:hypothetical protein
MGAVPIEAPPYWRTSPERALCRQGLGNRIGGMGEVLRAPKTTREARIRLRGPPLSRSPYSWTTSYSWCWQSGTRRRPTAVHVTGDAIFGHVGFVLWDAGHSTIWPWAWVLTDLDDGVERLRRVIVTGQLLVG